MKELNEQQQVLYEELLKTLNLMPYLDKAIEQADRLVESLLETHTEFTFQKI